MRANRTTFLNRTPPHLKSWESESLGFCGERHTNSTFLIQFLTQQRARNEVVNIKHFALFASQSAKRVGATTYLASSKKSVWSVPISPIPCPLAKWGRFVLVPVLCLLAYGGHRSQVLVLPAFGAQRKGCDSDISRAVFPSIWASWDPQILQIGGGGQTCNN